MAEIRIRDGGVGIPPTEQPLLCQRFVRLPRDLASTVPGNGLGLYLCQQLAERMGGRITIESTDKPGDGTTFVARLPVPPPRIERIA